MPASQLTQLKAALTSAGLNRKSASKKDKKTYKKGGARETDRTKKQQKLDDIRRGLNKFDEKETKVTFPPSSTDAVLTLIAQIRCRW